MAAFEQPRKTIKLTDEQIDRIIEVLDYSRHPDATALIQELYSQQHFNPADEPTNPITGKPYTHEEKVNSLARSIMHVAKIQQEQNK